MNHQRIYLIGMPASGKTTIGQALAQKLSYPFIDLDWEIEQRAGLSIPDIFSQFGEAHFRTLEKEALHSTLPQPAVIATGGGAPCFFDNMGFLLKNGKVFFINTSLALLAQRTWAKSGSRPLLAHASEAALLQAIEEKWAQREAYYRQAHYEINSTATPISTIIQYLSS